MFYVYIMCMYVYVYVYVCRERRSHCIVFNNNAKTKNRRFPGTILVRNMYNNNIIDLKRSEMDVRTPTRIEQKKLSHGPVYVVDQRFPNLPTGGPFNKYKNNYK